MMSQPQNTDERELLQRLRDGDHAAFEQLYHAYKVKLIANSLRLLKSRELVEELLQDLFLKLWEQRRKIDPEQSINAYLYKLANNMAYDTFRKISRDKRLYGYLLSTMESHYDHIESYLFSKENREELRKAIDLLPPQQKKVFILCKLEEKSYEEVSQLLHITTGTINNHIHRANLFLKDYFTSRSRSGVAIAILSYLLFRELD